MTNFIDKTNTACDKCEDGVYSIKFIYIVGESGRNTLCFYCGFGQGVIPCDCSFLAELKAWDILSDEALRCIID